MLPWPIRIVFTMLMKRKYLYNSLPAGFKAPKRFQPSPIDTVEALDSLRKAVGRMKSESNRVMHPAFGHITREEWDQFNLRHCEMHMSFIKGYPHLCRGKSIVAGALRFAIIVGGYHWTVHVLAEAAKHSIEPLSAWFSLETTYLVIQFVLGGFLFAWIYRKREKAL